MALESDCMRDVEVGAAVGIPPHAYVDQSTFDAEVHGVFGRTWTAVALSSDVPHAGDVAPVSLGRLPIVLVRNRGGQLRAFHNVCSHRGITLVEEAQTGRPVLVCPYHAWSYTLDGELVRTPNIGGPGVHACAGFDTAGLGLKPIACDEWAGVVFLNLDGAAAPLLDHLGPLIRRWGDIDLATATYGGGLRFELRANWKLGCENFIERYHLPSVHPALSGYSSVDGTYSIFGDPLFLGVGAAAYTSPDVDGPALPLFPAKPGAPALAEYVSVFPNLLLGRHADHFYAFLMIPRGPDRTEERFEFFFPGAAATSVEHGPARAALMERRRVTNLEDIGIVERLQRGMASPAFGGARFSPFFEETTLRFQRAYAAALEKGTGLNINRIGSAS